MSISSSSSVGSMDSSSCSVSSSSSSSLTSTSSSCLDRVSNAILFHQKDYSFDHVRSFFSADMSEEDVRLALEEDRRFSLNETEEGVFVGRANITLQDSRLLQAVEKWKDQMSVYFRENHCDVKLCMLSQLVKRPADVPKHVKLVDVLNSDLLRRFLLISSPNSGGAVSGSKKKAEDTVVKYKCTPQEVEEYHEQWRRNVVGFLLQQPHPVPLVAIGTHVVKPKNLGKNQKLIDVVKLDPLKRFRTHVDTSHNSLTRLSVTEDYACEHWRQQIFYALQNSHSNRLMDLNVNGVQRPACLPRSVTMRSVILNDPQQRFRHAADYEQLRRVQTAPQPTSSRPNQGLPNGHSHSHNFHPQSHHQRPTRSQPLHNNNHNVGGHSFQTHWPAQQISGRNMPYQIGQMQPPAPPRRRMDNIHTYHSQSDGVSMSSVPPGFTSNGTHPSPALPAHGGTYGNGMTAGMIFPHTSTREPQSQLLENRQEEVVPLSFDRSVSADFDDFCTPPNFLTFLNDPTGSSCSGGSGKGVDNCTSAIAVPATLLEKTVSSEFQEYSSIPGLLRFLSDAF